MIISGYLMAFNATQREAVEPIHKPGSWLKFYVRRFFRLAPTYYVALACAVILAGPFINGYTVLADRINGMSTSVYHPRYTDYSFWSIVTHVSFIFGFLPQWTLSTLLPDWSLGLEMQFYLVFPFVLLLMRRFGYFTVSIALIALCTVVIHTFNVMPGIRGSMGLFPEPSFILVKLPVFLVGMLISEAIMREGLQEKQRIRICVFALLVVLFEAFLYPLFRHEIWIPLVLTALMIWLTSDFKFYETQREKVNNKIRNKFWKFMSDASYSVYLFHTFFISIIGGALFSNARFLALKAPVRTITLWILVTACSYILAHFSQRYIEKPGIELGRKIIKKMGR